MSDREHTTACNLPHQRAWYARGRTLLIGFVLSYATLFGVLHVVAYTLGLRWDPPCCFPCLALTLLALLTLVLLLLLTIRMVRAWRRRAANRRRLMWLHLLVITAIVIYLVLPFTRFGFPRYKTYTAGFRRYVKVNVDLNAMRAWLSTLDRKRCSDYVYDLGSGGTIESRWPETRPWARAITHLEPHSAMLSLDGDGHPAIWIGRSGWGRSGLVVGSEKMRVPPAGFVEHKEYRLPLDSGAYVWHEVN